MDKQTKALTRFRRRLASNGPGMIVAVIALVVALCGGAFAATASKSQNKKGGVVITSINQIKPSVRAQLKGSTGPQGVPGKDGANGVNGKDGLNGKDGVNGKNGTDGAPGESVVMTPIGAGTAHCLPQGDEGGVEVRLEGQAPETGEEVCNGKKGADGTTGFTETLPAGATETGAWFASGEGEVYAPLSFSIPMAKAIKLSLVSKHIFYGSGEEPEIEVSAGVFEKTEFQKHCENNFKVPKVVNVGELCVYENTAETTPGTTYNGVFRMATTTFEGATVAGGLLSLTLPGPGHAMGTFAVKGCNEAEPEMCP